MNIVLNLLLLFQIAPIFCMDGTRQGRGCKKIRDFTELCKQDQKPIEAIKAFLNDPKNIRLLNHKDFIHRWIETSCEDGQQDNLGLLEIFITYGVNISQGDPCGRTPVYYATYFQRAEALDILLNNQADCNGSDNFDDTPLHKICKKICFSIELRCAWREDFTKFISITHKLLDAGADTMVKNCDFKTPFEILVDPFIAPCKIANGSSLEQEMRLLLRKSLISQMHYVNDDAIEVRLQDMPDVIRQEYEKLKRENRQMLCMLRFNNIFPPVCVYDNRAQLQNISAQQQSARRSLTARHSNTPI